MTMKKEMDAENFFKISSMFNFVLDNFSCPTLQIRDIELILINITNVGLLVVD